MKEGLKNTALEFCSPCLILCIHRKCLKGDPLLSTGGEEVARCGSVRRKGQRVPAELRLGPVGENRPFVLNSV